MSGGLGFRKLHDFNVALLGKQGWRLITSPESLVSKIYKARYYPDGSFLSAKAGANPSYIWRSILEAQVLLKQGAVRRIGSGNSVAILHDPWLPHDNDPYVHTVHEALNGRSVACLMIPGENQWDVDLINDIFTERDANLILSIPLRRTDMDSWYWRMEKMGQYTVKSAYAAIQASGEENQSNVNSDFWRKLWNLKIPPKVKNFLWRALTGCLPTKDQLLVKKVDVNATCPVCNIDPENVLHTLVLCPFASLCWVKVGCRNEEREYMSFIDWMNEAFQKHTGDAMKTISMVCWSIWKNMNEIVWNKKGVEFTEVVESALLVLNQWKSAQDRSFDNSLGFMTQTDGDEHWERPPKGIVKVNTDAALFEESNCYSYSMLARNLGGDLMEAVSCCRQGSIAPELAEAIGIREALSWVKTKVWPKVVVETDCLLITQAIRWSSVNLSYIGRVVDECKQLLSELRDRNVTLKFVKRSANKVAHYLARYNSSVADRVWKGGDIHLEFFHVLLDDLKF